MIQVEAGLGKVIQVNTGLGTFAFIFVIQVNTGLAKCTFISWLKLTQNKENFPQFCDS